MLLLLLNPDILDLCCVFDAHACVSVCSGTFAVLIYLHDEDLVSQSNMLEFDLGAVARFVEVTFERHLAEGFCGSCIVRIWGKYRGCGSDP